MKSRLFIRLLPALLLSFCAVLSCRKDDISSGNHDREPEIEPEPEPALSADSMKVSITGFLNYFDAVSPFEDNVSASWSDSVPVYVVGRVADTSRFSLLGVLTSDAANDSGGRVAELTGIIRRPTADTRLTLLCSTVLTDSLSVSDDGAISIDLSSQDIRGGQLPYVAFATIDYIGRTYSRSAMFDFATSLLKVSLNEHLAAGVEVTGAVLGRVGTVCRIVLSDNAAPDLSCGGEGTIAGNFTDAFSDERGGFGFCLATAPSPPNVDRRLLIAVKGGEKYEYGSVATGVMTCGKMYALTRSSVDLSEAGTANCYVVTSTGDYKFNATVRGNGRNLDGTAAAAVRPASADVLWETFGTPYTPETGSLVRNVVLVGDYVHFTATERRGNALIAVRDASGTILWSWHIWLTDRPADHVYAGGAGTLMDRNLGAVSADFHDGVLTFGLMYQWGRKDPFAGCCGVALSDRSAERAASTMSEWPGVIGPKSLDYVCRNPSTQILSSGDWLTPHNSSLWGSDKALYDPCPAGYRVPDKDVWEKADFSGATGFTDGVFDGYYIGYNFDDLSPGKTVWYPCIGYVGKMDVGAHGEQMSFYWTCMPSGNVSAYRWYVADSQFLVGTTSARAYCHGVRCARIE